MPDVSSRLNGVSGEFYLWLVQSSSLASDRDGSCFSKKSMLRFTMENNYLSIIIYNSEFNN